MDSLVNTLRDPANELESTERSARREAVDTLSRDGATHLDNGRFDEAEACYQRVLQLDEGHAEAYFKLGNIALKRLLPADAEANYRRAIASAPRYVKALYNLGNLLLRQSRLAEAEDCYRSAIAADPGYCAAHINLGVTLKDLGRPTDAEASYRTALALEPDDADTLNNLGAVLGDQGRQGEAEAVCRQSLTLAPRNALTWNNLGIILQEQSRLVEAEAAYRTALQLAPNYPEAHNNLGITLRAQGRLEQAVHELRQAIGIKPTYANAYNNLGAILVQLGQVGDAEELYRQVLEFDASNAQTLNSLGGVLAGQGRPEEAIICFRRALQIDPDLLAAHSNLLFALNYSGKYGTTSLVEEAHKFGRAVKRKVKSRFSTWSCPLAPQRLRVGLVSADLRHHPVGFFLESLLAHIDTTRVELIAYPTGRLEDDATARMRPHFIAWKSIVGLGDEAAARLIHADGIHILIDLAGHTTDNRLPLFGWKPAPVQASWLGYFATTGVSEIDYLLATRTEIPDTHHDQFAESIWYLPETRLCFSPPRIEIPVSGLPALRNGFPTFGCFQNLSKIGDGVLDLWAGILAALPAAHLRLQCQQLADTGAKAQLAARLQQRGVDLDRLTMLGSVERESYLGAHAEVDVILDTFPYPGGTTTCEALWMGVPTLTLAGDTLLERQGASFLTVAGLPDWIAPNKSEYVNRAIAAASDLERLADLRSTLRQQVMESPLFDAPRFARRLEDAFWQMWREWQTSYRAGNDA